jgi:hypothetical protein
VRLEPNEQRRGAGRKRDRVADADVARERLLELADARPLRKLARAQRFEDSPFFFGPDHRLRDADHDGAFTGLN